MSGDTAAAMLADLIGAAGFADLLAPAANPANAANREHRRGLAGGSSRCEGLRIAANAGRDSQEFASVRRGTDGPEAQHSLGFSQDSQNSQGVGCITADSLAGVAWTDADIDAFTERRARLMRWGWPELEAEALAERLVRRAREHDDRTSCTDCAHFRPGHCGNHRRAGLHGAELGRDLAGLMQRCAGFASREDRHGGE